MDSHVVTNDVFYSTMKTMKTASIALAGMFACMPSLALAGDPVGLAEEVQNENNQNWAKADAAILAYASKFEKKRPLTELKSPLIKKLLPDHRLIARIGPDLDPSFTWLIAVSREGELDEFIMATNMHFLDRDQPHATKLTGFLRRQKVRLNKPEDAIPLVYLVEEIMLGSMDITVWRNPEENNDKLDIKVINPKYAFHNNKHYKYVSKKTKKGFNITVASKGQNDWPVYEVFTDKKGHFFHARETTMQKTEMQLEGVDVEPNPDGTDPFGI